MIKAINLDMDGTFVDLYGVNNWLENLIARNTKPYEIAKPLVNLSALARVLNRKQREGFQINVISWTAKNSTQEYNKRVEEAKRAWLAKHLPSVKFDNISIVDYGTPKSQCGRGYLFDDEEPNRKEWGAGAFSAEGLVKKIRELA